MRVSTSMIFSQGTDAIARQQAEMLHNQQQIAAGRRVLTAADDPIAAAEALTVTQSKDATAQYSTNVDTAKTALGLNDSVLGQLTNVLQSIRVLAVNGGNAGLNDNDRASLATDVAGQLEQLIGLANTRDGNGNYLFSGYQIDTQPFVTTSSANVSYNGDQGQRLLQVSAARSLAINENGSAVFEQIKNGNGTFTAGAASANTGTGVIDGGRVTNASALTGDTYRLQFNVAGGVTTYDVIDVTTSSTVSSANAYTPGAAITVDGMQVSLSGGPSAGDQFTLSPSGQQSIFTTIQNLIACLSTPAAGATGAARLANGVGRTLQDIDGALENILTARASVGAGMRELDALASGNEDRITQYQQRLSQLQDLDYNKALSDFAQQQLSLQAAEKSFVQVSGLSLFNFL